MPRNPVFQPAPFDEFWKNVSVGHKWQDDWFYARGYIKAADALVDVALSKPVPDQYFYPICFNYRHACELTLKELIRETERLIGLMAAAGEPKGDPRDVNETSAELAKTHSLEELLNWLEQRLAHLSEERLPTEVREAIIAVHNVDPSGQVFRYSRARNGERHEVFQDTTHIDLVWVRERLGKAIEFLQAGVGGWLENELNVTQDYLS